MPDLPSDLNEYRWMVAGFMKCILSPHEYIHLWTEAWSGGRAESSIHDHSYYFKSKVLFGELKFTEYKVEMDSDGDYGLWSGVFFLGKCRLIKVEDFIIRTGETYEFGGPGRFHDIPDNNGTVMTHVLGIGKNLFYPIKFVFPLGVAPIDRVKNPTEPSRSEMKEEISMIYKELTHG